METLIPVETRLRRHDLPQNQRDKKLKRLWKGVKFRLDGSFMAVVLLCLAYVERELAAGLYAAGWEPAEKARLAVVLEKAYEDGTLCELEWQAYRDLAGLRNSHAHFRVPGSPTSRMYRVVDENALGTEILARDAKRAVAAVAGLVKRQSGMRVGLGASEE